MALIFFTFVTFLYIFAQIYETFVTVPNTFPGWGCLFSTTAQNYEYKFNHNINAKEQVNIVHKNILS